MISRHKFKKVFLNQEDRTLHGSCSEKINVHDTSLQVFASPYFEWFHTSLSSTFKAANAWIFIRRRTDRRRPQPLVGMSWNVFLIAFEDSMRWSIHCMQHHAAQSLRLLDRSAQLWPPGRCCLFLSFVRICEAHIQLFHDRPLSYSADMFRSWEFLV